MTWSDPISDLEKFISDQDGDKLRHRKRVLGRQDGTNVTFKTLEFRRVTDFTAVTGAEPEGVYVDGVKATIDTDNQVVGEFKLEDAPSGNQELTATYYVKWFTDDELTTFLVDSANVLSVADSYTQIPEGLRPAALNFAASNAYQKLSLRWADTLSDTYKLQDAPDDDMSPVDQYSKMAETFRKTALMLRDDYYKRQGQYLSPLYGTSTRPISPVTPNR